MSGTSVDAVDALAVRWEGPELHTIGGLEHPISPALRSELIGMSGDQRFTFEALKTLDTRVAALHGEAVNALITTYQLIPADIKAIGFHGQTVFHAPDAESPFTVQLGNPSQLAAMTGLPVVADVRSADMALGGQGAPLAPGLHNALFRDAKEARAVLNLGGIANLTLLPRDDGPVRGFDTGPANALMDAWCAAHLKTSRDNNGEMAALGHVDEGILLRLLDCPFFERTPPKSTGREMFSLEWLQTIIGPSSISDADALATLTELTAVTVAGALRAHFSECERVLVAGGGRHNQFLMSRLQHHVPCPIEMTDAHGADGDTLEALLMAWIARQRLMSAPANIPSVTGASAPTPLGGLFLPPFSA